MSLPFFFVNDLNERRIVLDEDTSKHVISVLRKEIGGEILLTDGRGKKARATIVDDNRKKCLVEISVIEEEKQKQSRLAIGISLIKNLSRFEWFLEKATEIGVNEIIPLICDRTEKEKFRHDRLQQILISAMLQSQQTWLPVLYDPVPFKKTVELSFDQKFIAHCLPGEKNSLKFSVPAPASSLILIGPEGDFTSAEIEMAIKNNFQAVSLGTTRLRTETAGIAAAVLLGLGSGN
jgi:16S rRNA (uracil1498-N3)-methyltransferase